MVLEKTLESPLDCKEIQPVHSKGDQPWVFFGRTDDKAETPILWPHHASPAVQEMGDAGLIPGSGRFPGGGYGNPLQNSCLENPMDSGGCRATVHGVAQSDTTEVTEHAHMHGTT